MINIFLSGSKGISDFFPFAFGGMLSMTSIVASILLFLAKDRISQATKMLEDLNSKILNGCFKNDEGDLRKIKLWLNIYATQWNDARLPKDLRFLLYLFFISAFAIVLFFLNLLCNNASELNENFVFVILSTPLFVFLFIIYEILEAPQSLIFRQSRPHMIIGKKPYMDLFEGYISSLDLLGIERSENDPLRSIRIARDNIYVYFYNLFISFKRFI